MNYKGKLYAKVGGKYVDSGITSDDYDKLLSSQQVSGVSDEEKKTMQNLFDAIVSGSRMTEEQEAYDAGSYYDCIKELSYMLNSIPTGVSNQWFSKEDMIGFADWLQDETTETYEVTPHKRTADATYANCRDGYRYHLESKKEMSHEQLLELYLNQSKQS